MQNNPRKVPTAKASNLRFEPCAQPTPEDVRVVVNRRGTPEYAQRALVDEATCQVIIGTLTGHKRSIHAFVQQGIQRVGVRAGIHLGSKEAFQRDANSLREFHIGNQAAGRTGRIGERNARALEVDEFLSTLARQ